VIEKKGTRFGFLDYNCVGPEETWANRVKPGCAYLHIVSAYEINQPCPGSTPNIFTFAEPHTLKAMVNDIIKLRPLCDVLVVKFHKGLGFVRAKIADYEQQISYAAIDAGADLILGEHAHMLKGIEEYKGKVIFHGLNHFTHCFQTFSKEKVQEARDWHKELYNSKTENLTGQDFVADADVFKTMIAKLTINNGKITGASYLPVWLNKQDQPEILKHDARGQVIFDYMDQITQEAGLNVKYEWEGDEIKIRW
jgi:poly-gamma-glutamate capsule biosynthesis protein CapA/YwtB (metallophosphatase superfamily)